MGLDILAKVEGLGCADLGPTSINDKIPATGTSKKGTPDCQTADGNYRHPLLGQVDGYFRTDSLTGFTS